MNSYRNITLRLILAHIIIVLIAPFYLNFLSSIEQTPSQSQLKAQLKAGEILKEWSEPDRKKGKKETCL